MIFTLCLNTNFRGSEFGVPEALETGTERIQHTSIYYCTPMRSKQNGGIENTHTVLRMALSKGGNFKQWDINLIVNYINSTSRKSLNEKTPYGTALECLVKMPRKCFSLNVFHPV